MGGEENTWGLHLFMCCDAFYSNLNKKKLSKKCYTDLYLQLEEDQTRPTTSLPFIVRMQLKIYFNLND